MTDLAKIKLEYVLNNLFIENISDDTPIRDDLHPGESVPFTEDWQIWLIRQLPNVTAKNFQVFVKGNFATYTFSHLDAPNNGWSARFTVSPKSPIVNYLLTESQRGVFPKNVRIAYLFEYKEQMGVPKAITTRQVKSLSVGDRAIVFVYTIKGVHIHFGASVFRKQAPSDTFTRKLNRYTAFRRFFFTTNDCSMPLPQKVEEGEVPPPLPSIRSVLRENLFPLNKAKKEQDALRPIFGRVRLMYAPSGPNRQIATTEIVPWPVAPGNILGFC